MKNQTDTTELDNLRNELVTELSATEPPKPAEGAEVTPKPGESSTPKPENTDPNAKPKEGEKPAEKPGDKPGEKKPEGQTDDKGEKKPEGSETPYNKAKKDSERLRVNWSELERGKTELKAALAELENQRKLIAQERQQIEAARLQVASATTKQSKYTPEQLETFAKEFDAEGKGDFAAQCRARAKELRDAVGVEREQQTKQQHEHYAGAIKEHWTKAQADFPDVAVKDSPLNKRATEVFKTVADELVKNGMRPAPSLHYLAVQHADALIRAETATAKAQGLEAKVKELETENQRLTKSTAIPGAKPAQSAPPAKDIASLPLDQQRAALLKDLEPT